MPRRSTQRMPRRRAAAGGSGSYWDRSRRPLQILAFLLPLIIAYEVGLVLLLRSEKGVVFTNIAHRTLLDFFASFGVAPASGFYLGGAVIVVVLLVWHMLSRQRWEIDVPTGLLMVAESAVLALPLLVLWQLAASTVEPAAWATPPRADAPALGMGSWLAISIGAGLYEELVFRMLLIALIHTLIVDVAGASNAVGSTIAVIVSALAFAWYHTLDPSQAAMPFHKLAFLAAAGLYFGAVYVARGFGLAVGAHAAYDVFAVTMFGPPGS